MPQKHQHDKQEFRLQERLIDASVFRAYDIRGIVGQMLDEDAYFTLGRALAVRLHQLGEHQAFIGYDGRLTSPAFAQALAQGLLRSGIDVYDLGAVSTPILYYATHAQKPHSGFMVTGSHNPADYNGLKMVLGGKTLVQEDIQLIYEIVCAQSFLDGRGYYEHHPILADYSARIVDDIQLQRPLKAVVDCGNGIAGMIAPQVLRELGCEVIPLYCDVDGRFPNHHPDPTVEENLADLKAAVAKHQADIGLAFDGDADRLGVITEQGKLIWPDRLMMFYAKSLLQDNPGATVVFDVKCSSHLPRIIKQYGGIAKMCPTGHSIVKGIMKQSQALLAGEMSGHLFFAHRWYGFDDALYSACRLLEILSHSPQSVSAQFAVIPDSINTPEIKIAISEAEKFSFMEAFKNQAKFENCQIITIDGIRVEFPYGWGLLRASNTTPCLIARFEAIDAEKLELIKQQFKQELSRLNPKLSIDF